MILTAKPNVEEKRTCEKHGEYSVKYIELFDRWLEVSVCPTCSKIASDEREAQERLQRQLQEQRKLHEAKREAGISLRNIDVDFEHFKCELPEEFSAKQKAQNYADDVINGGSGCLIMVGNVGAGKTMLATAIAEKVLAAGKKCSFVKFSDLIREIKDSWRKDSQYSESDVIAHYSKVKLLILDEIGVQYGSDTEKMMIFEIIDGRYENVLPTVLISNLDFDGVRKCIGERVFDRLRHDGGQVIAFTWQSKRG